MLRLKTKEVLDKQVTNFERGLVVPFILRPLTKIDQRNLSKPLESKIFSAIICVKGFLHPKTEVLHG